MELSEILALLTAQGETGTAASAALSKMIGGLRTESATHRTKSKAILDKLGVAAETDLDDLIAEMETLKASGQKPSELTGKLSKLERDFATLNAKLSASEQRATEERAKRIKASANSELLKNLQAGNAANPAAILGIFAPAIKAGDNDALMFVADDGAELTIADGVKNWLRDNPWAVKNTQSNGGTGGTNAGAGGGGALYTKAEMEKLTPQQMADNPKKLSDSLEALR